MHGSIWSHRLCYNYSWSGVFQPLPSQGRPRIPMFCLTMKYQRNRNNEPYWCYDLPLLTSQVGADVLSLVFFAPVLDSPSAVSKIHISALTRNPIYAWDPKSYSVLSRPQHVCGFPFKGYEPFWYYVSSEVYWFLLIGTVYLRTQDKYKPNVFHVT